MDNITFDVNQKDIEYFSEGKRIYVYSDTIKFLNYKSFKHIYGSPKATKNIKFKIKLTSGHVITIDSSGINDGDYKIQSLEFYYTNKDDIDPVTFVITVQPVGGYSGRMTLKEFNYKFRELAAYGNGSTAKLTSLTKIDSLNQGVLDEEYKAVNTEIKIDVNHANGNYEEETSKCIGDMGKCTVNVNVTGPSQLSGVDFVYYTYKFTGDGFNKLEFKSAEFYHLSEFNGSDFNDINLDIIIVYYYIQDSQRILPLVIEFRPKSGKQFRNQKKEKSVLYKLETIIPDEKDNQLSKIKLFYSNDKTEHYIKNKLQSIYKDEDIRLNIEKLIGLKKESMTEYIILGVILLIYIPVAVLSYIYYNKIMSALRSVYNKFRNCIIKS